MTEPLYRHPTDRVIAGVAGGLATWLNLDPSLVRVAWVLLGIFSGGAFVLVYIVMMIVVPLPPAGTMPRARDAGSTGWQPGPGAGWGSGPGAGPGWGPGPAAGWGAPADPAAGTPPTSGWGVPPPGGWASGDGRPTPGRNGPASDSVGIVAGIVLIGLGAWFLVDQFVHIDWNLVWPIVVMVAGGALIAGALLRGRHS